MGEALILSCTITGSNLVNKAKNVFVVNKIVLFLTQHGHSALVGAPVQSEITDETKQQLMDLALGEFHCKSNSVYRFQCMSLSEHKSQVKSVYFYLYQNS